MREGMSFFKDHYQVLAYQSGVLGVELWIQNYAMASSVSSFFAIWFH